MELIDESGWVISITKNNILYFLYDFNYKGEPEIDEDFLMATTFKEEEADRIIQKLIEKKYDANKLWLTLKLELKE